MMKTSKRGMMEIIAHEAIVLSPYRDAVGVWTIGVGHTAQTGNPDPETLDGAITLDDALEIFARDLERFERRVRAAFTRPLAQHEFDAAVSFDFNTGGIDRATWVQTFNAGDRTKAVNEIMNWSKPPAIIGRRKREQALFDTGQYSSDGTAILYPATKKGRVQWSKGRKIQLADALARLRSEKSPTDKTEAPRPSFWVAFIAFLGKWLR